MSISDIKTKIVKLKDCALPVDWPVKNVGTAWGPRRSREPISDWCGIFRFHNRFVLANYRSIFNFARNLVNTTQWTPTKNSVHRLQLAGNFQQTVVGFVSLFITTFRLNILFVTIFHLYICRAALKVSLTDMVAILNYPQVYMQLYVYQNSIKVFKISIKV